jgi:hypothetical protein
MQLVRQSGPQICETKAIHTRTLALENGQCFRLYEDPTYSSQWGFLFTSTARFIFFIYCWQKKSTKELLLWWIAPFLFK